MEDSVPHLDTLLELEARHEDLLLRLDELDRRVASVLTECRASHEPAPGDRR